MTSHQATTKVAGQLNYFSSHRPHHRMSYSFTAFATSFTEARSALGTGDSQQNIHRTVSHTQPTGLVHPPQLRRRADWAMISLPLRRTRSPQSKRRSDRVIRVLLRETFWDDLGWTCREGHQKISMAVSSVLCGFLIWRIQQPWSLPAYNFDVEANHIQREVRRLP